MMQDREFQRDFAARRPSCAARTSPWPRKVHSDDAAPHRRVRRHGVLRLSMAAGAAHRRRRSGGRARAALRRADQGHRCRANRCAACTRAGRSSRFRRSRRFRSNGSALALNALLPPRLLAFASVRWSTAISPPASRRASGPTSTRSSTGRERSALLARYAYHVTRSLDLAAMRAAAACLVGEHDFRSFARRSPETATVRHVARLEIEPARRAGSDRDCGRRFPPPHGAHDRRAR